MSCHDLQYGGFLTSVTPSSQQACDYVRLSYFCVRILYVMLRREEGEGGTGVMQSEVLYVCTRTNWDGSGHGGRSKKHPYI